MRLSGFIVVLLVAMSCIGGLLYAQSGDVVPRASTSSPKRDAKGKARIAVTPEREAAVLNFVQRNHTELAELLAYLKSDQPEEYERAIKEIFRTTERLALIQERDPLQYELEVALWTGQSRVQLLAAKLKMSTSEDLVKQLRDALARQNESRLALLKHERQKAADRLEKLEGDIVRFESDREKVIDRQLQLLTRAAEEGRPAKLSGKNAVKVKKNAKSPETKPANQSTP
jgi:hypothetical protein